LRLSQALVTRGGGSTLPKYAYPRFTSFWCGSGVGPNACATGHQNTGSQMVLVTRQDVGNVATWTIVADQNLGYAGADDLSEIVEQTNSSTALSRGLYRTRFRVVVRCIAGCSALSYPPM
jgi:hypothetical protein